MSQARSRILVAGPIVEDVHRFADGSSTRYPGGNATIVACALADRGVPAAVMADVGDDAGGDAAAEILARHGVDRSLVRRSAEPTKRAVIDVNRDGAWSAPGAPVRSRAYLPDPGELADARAFTHLHLAGINSLLRSDGDRVRALLERFRCAGLPISCGMNRFGDVAAEVAFLRDELPADALTFCNVEEYTTWTGVPVADRDGLVDALEAGARRRCVVTCGADGAAARIEDVVAFEPAATPPSPIRSTVGAGDVFSAAFLAAMLGGDDVRACLQEGCRAAARSLAGARWDDGWAS